MPRDDDRDDDLDWLSAQLEANDGPLAEQSTPTPQPMHLTDAPVSAPQATAPDRAAAAPDNEPEPDPGSVAVPEREQESVALGPAEPSARAVSPHVSPSAPGPDASGGAADAVPPAADPPATPPAPWWTTPMVSAWAPTASDVPDAVTSAAPRASDAEPEWEPAPKDVRETEAEAAADDAADDNADDTAATRGSESLAVTEIMPAGMPHAAAPATAVLPQPLPLTRAVEASEATPVAAMRHSSGRRVGIETKRPTTLVWVLAGVVVVIVLVGLFFVGQRLGSEFLVAAPIPTNAASSPPESTASETPTPTASPTVAAEVTAIQSAGVHPWNTLFGGECLEPYDSPWAQEFTVVECATAHTAQVVFRGTFDADPASAFPGEAALAAQINVLCSAVGLIDLTAAAALADVQVQGSYPVSDEQWSAGERHYYCFVSRSSGEALTAPLAGRDPTA